MPGGRICRLAVASVLVATALAWGPAIVEPAGAATSTFGPANCIPYGCGPSLKSAINQLGPGDTLEIEAGTYVIGQVTISGLAGGLNAPITITAADPSHRPTLQGNLRLYDPRYVTLSELRLQAVADEAGEFPAINVRCGVGWIVRDSDIFGAKQSGAKSNMNIAGHQTDHGGLGPCPGEPRGFLVTGNCFFAPYVDPDLPAGERSFYHNIYGSFEGADPVGSTPGTGGKITHNIFMGNRNGAGIKLHNAENENLGPWNVKIWFNTFYNGLNGVRLGDNVRDNDIKGNLLHSMRGDTDAGARVGVYVTRLTTTSNTMTHNWFSDMYTTWAKPANDPPPNDKGLTLGTDNALRGDPGFDSTTCGGFVPSNPNASLYGHLADANGDGSWGD